MLPDDQGTRKCEDCEFPLPTGQDFCPACGVSLPREYPAGELSRYSWAWHARVGDPSAKFVLVALVHFDFPKDTGVRGIVWPSIAKIAERTELSARTVRRGLDHLEENGFIIRRPRYLHAGRQASNAYVLKSPGGCHSDRGEGVTVTPKEVKKERG